MSVPCRTVGGDFYDYVDVSDTEFGFALGDVAGKGPPAAMLAAVVQSNFGALAPVTREPAEMMLRLNQALLRRADRRAVRDHVLRRGQAVRASSATATPGRSRRW